MIKKIFRLAFMCTLLSGLFVLAACGDDDEVVVPKGMEFRDLQGDMTVYVMIPSEGGPIAKPCGTKKVHAQFLSNESNTIGAIRIDHAFETDRFYDWDATNGTQISSSKLEIQNIELSNEGDGNYYIHHVPYTATLERLSMSGARLVELKDLEMEGFLSGRITTNGKIDIDYSVNKLGQMPYRMVVKYKN